MIQTSRNTTSTATTFLVTITKQLHRRRPRHPWFSSSTASSSSSWFLLPSSTSSFQLQHRQQQYCNYTTTRCKYFSSSTRYKNKNKKQKKTSSSSSSSFELQALPFTISPEAALAKFRNWSEQEQGLQYLMQYDSIRIGAAYVPCWSFGLNLRFRQQHSAQQSQSQTTATTPFSWKPPIFDIYDTVATKRTRTTTRKPPAQDVIYLPGVSSYAGYTYRRSVIDPVHATTLCFLEQTTNTTTEPFGSWMLQDMVLQDSGEPVRVIPDVWTATQRQAFASLKAQVQALTTTAWYADKHNHNNNTAPPPTVQTQVVSARRVFMPTFVIEYTILGLEYQAFVSGCDTVAPVGGVSHRLFETTTRTTANRGFLSASTTTRNTTKEFHRSSQTILRRLFVSSQEGGDTNDNGGGAAATLVATAKTLVRNIPLPILLGFVRPVWNTLFFVLLRVVSMIPIVGVAGGVFAGFRKIIRPYLDNKFANADWERQRQHEYEERRREQDNNHQQYYQDNDDKSQKPNYSMHDFDDTSGRARQHFNRNKDRILRSLSGDNTTAPDHKDRAGDFDWYADWQTWAQHQWKEQAKQQQQQQKSYYNYQQQQQQHKSYQQGRRSKAKNNKSKSTTKNYDSKYNWPFDATDPYSVLGIDRSSATDSDVSAAFRKEMLKYHPDTQPNISAAHKARAVERSKLITNAYRTIKTARRKQ